MRHFLLRCKHYNSLIPIIQVRSSEIKNVYVGIKKQLEKHLFKVYSQNGTIVVNNRNNIGGRLIIYDNFGRLIYEGYLVAGKNSIPIQTSGIYFVRLTEGKRVVDINKVFVNK